MATAMARGFISAGEDRKLHVIITAIITAVNYYSTYYSAP